MKKSMMILLAIIGLNSVVLASVCTRDDAKGVVNCKVTKLMWQDDLDINKSIRRTWSESIEYCEDLGLAGYTDWRLPNVNELESIVDYERFVPAIAPAFKYIGLAPDDFAKWHYWTSTSLSTLLNHAGSVSFRVGMVFFNKYKKSVKLYARCVRGGE